MSLGEQITAVIVVEAGLFFLTQPEELRRYRWLRLLVSLPLFWCALTFFLPLFICGVGLLAVMWSDVLAHYLSGGLTNLLHRDITSETGIKADFHYARNHRRDGETQKAIAAIEHELKKEPANYEGLMLLAEIYQDLNQPEEALQRLQIIVDGPSATQDQKNYALWEQEKCRQLQRHLQEQQFFKQQQSSR